MVKILFAEDKQDVAELMIEILEYHGYEVDWFENGARAIERLQENSAYDLVITDVLMPEKDGFDLTQFIKSEKLNIPIIVVSGGGITLSADSALEAIEDDADAILKKPVNIQDLKSTIDKLVS